MKTTTLVLILFLTGLDLLAQTTPPGRRSPAFPAFPAKPPMMIPPPPVAPAPNSLPSAKSSLEEMIPAGNINFQGVDVSQVLDVYAQLVGRTLLRAGLPSAQIVLKTETPLTKSEAIEALQAVLSLNGIAVVNVGDKFVKVVPSEQANSVGAAFNNSDAAQLPDLGSYVTHIVQLKYVKPSEMVPIIQPFAKLPNSILPIDSNGILVLRDNAENVKRMLEMIAQVDVSVPAVYISEVIPIKYAMADDIANALNSLGGGGSTVSIGSSGASSGAHAGNGTSTTGGGFNSMNSANGQPQTTGTSSFGGASGGARGGTGSTFQQRLQSIIQRASSGGGQDQIQAFGETKIIADERSNSLLVFATAQDMETIKGIVAKLDVLLSQVLIESVVLDVNLGKAWNFGVSAVQNPQTFQGNSTNVIQNIIGGGGINNGQPFYNFLSGSLGTNGTSNGFGNSLSGGLSYFGNIGPNWDVALAAAANDNSTTVIQKPRIQTSQAKPASFFVGETVPYVTGNSYGSVYGNSASYSQLSVGVELDVTPFINPDGLVVMDINQEIDALDGYTPIDNVGNVPNTTKKTFSSEVAVRDRDTIILGGFIDNETDKTRSGVPLLEDIPLLGNLFSSRTSNKTREEMLVLMRPTVLKTPELAAAEVGTEEKRLPGVEHAVAEDAEDRRKLIEAEERDEQKQQQAEEKAEQKRQRENQNYTPNSNSGFFTPASPAGTMGTNGAAVPNE